MSDLLGKYYMTVFFSFLAILWFAKDLKINSLGRAEIICNLNSYFDCPVETRKRVSAWCIFIFLAFWQTLLLMKLLEIHSRVEKSGSTGVEQQRSGLCFQASLQSDTSTSMPLQSLVLWRANLPFPFSFPLSILASHYKSCVCIKPSSTEHWLGCPCANKLSRRINISHTEPFLCWECTVPSDLSCI